MFTIEISEMDARRLLMRIDPDYTFPAVVKELVRVLTEYDRAQPKTTGPSTAERVAAIAAGLHLTPGCAVLVTHSAPSRLGKGKPVETRRGFFVEMGVPPAYIDGQTLYAKVQWAKRDGTPGHTTSQVHLSNLRVGPVERAARELEIRLAAEDRESGGFRR